jgi:hypothetical protein
MCTNIVPRITVVLIGLVLLGLMPARTDAQVTTPPGRLSSDESIDVALGALEEPTLQRAPVPFDRKEIAPLVPPYKQQPPASQEDFSSGTAGISPKGKKPKK